LDNLFCEKQIDPVVASSRRRPSVLLVDDSLTSRHLIKSMLENNDYSVTARIHGKQAYETMVESDGDFDILVSDVEMPYMDGLELIVEMRKMEKFRNFPIILISTLDSAAHRQRGLEVGADEYVAKGDFNSTALVETIERLLAR
jgi:two-component system, chemotaxis family, sensor kinase CheA